MILLVLFIEAGDFFSSSKKLTLPSSKISGLCLMKSSSKTLQNLPYLWKITSFVFHLEDLGVLPLNAPVNVNIDQGIYKVKFKVALNEKQKKTTLFFFFYKYSKF